MSNSSVPHPFRVLCEMGGKPQTLGVRAFPPMRQSTYRRSFDSLRSLRMTARMGHGGWLTTPKSLVYEEAAS